MKKVYHSRQNKYIDLNDTQAEAMIFNETDTQLRVKMRNINNIRIENCILSLLYAVVENEDTTILTIDAP